MRRGGEEKRGGDRRGEDRVGGGRNARESDECGEKPFVGNVELRSIRK